MVLQLHQRCTVKLPGQASPRRVVVSNRRMRQRVVVMLCCNVRVGSGVECKMVD